MKAQRRHELKENDLIHMLHEWWGYLRERGNHILLALAVVAVVFAVVSWGARSKARGVADDYVAMRDLKFTGVEDGKESLAALTGLIDASSSDPFTLDALLAKSEEALRLATSEGGDPNSELNAMAGAAFDDLLRRFPDKTIALGTAHLGLATVAENEFVLDGNIAHRDEARRHLEAVKGNATLNATPFMTAALDRLNLLDEVFVAVKFAPPLPPEPEAKEDTSPDQAGGDSTVSKEISLPAKAAEQPKEAPVKEAPAGSSETPPAGEAGTQTPPSTPGND